MKNAILPVALVFALVYGLNAAVTPVKYGNTWTFTVDSGTEAYTTAISGAVKVVKEGAGVLDLGTGSNTFIGGIEVNGGTLQGTLTALGGKLNVAPSTEAPQPLVSVADGATLSIVSTTCNGNYSARLAKELRVAGHGVGNAGAVQRPSGSGSMHNLFDKITLLGDTTFGAAQRWGFANESILDMGSHSLKIIGSENLFELYTGTVTVSNPGKIEIAAGTFLVQGAFSGDADEISLDNGTTMRLFASAPLAWSVSMPESATVNANFGTDRTKNIIAGDVSIGSKLTMNLDAANRVATLAGDIDGPGELLMNSAGTLYVTGSVERVVGKITQSNGKIVLENAGTFCVTNTTVGKQGFRPTTPAAKVAGAWPSVPRLSVANSTFTMPESAAGNTPATKKHHLFVGGANAEFGVLDIQRGGVVSNDLSVGRSAGSVGAVYLNDGGKLYWRGGLNNQGWIGDQGCGYLAVNDGGEFVSEGLLSIGAYGNANGNGGFGMVRQRGGTVRTTRSDISGANVIPYSIRLGRDNYSCGHWYQTGGTSTFANHIALCFADTLLNRSDIESVVTLSGEGTAMNIADGRYLESCVSYNAVTGVLNLNDGATLSVRRIFKNYASTAEGDSTTGMLKTQEVRESVAASKFYINFDGGILKPVQYGTLFNNRGGIYDDPDRITVYSGGAIVDTSLCTGGNLNWSAPIKKPSGNVLLSVSLPSDSSWTNKYIAPPRVAISGVNQHGATAVAELDEATGRLTGIVVTSPGNDVPGDITVTIKGGDLKNTFNCPFTVGAPAKDGGLVKRGANTLYIDVAAATPNTYEGPTVVEGGTLQFAYRTYPEASPLVLKGGAATFGGYAYTIPSLEGYGTVNGSGGITVTNEIRISCADLFGQGRSIAAQKVTLGSGVRLVITDPENLSGYKGEQATAFLTASTSLTGDAPTLDLDASYGEWKCTKSGNTLKFGARRGMIMLLK